MTLKENIMKLQTYKMFEDEDTLYVERDDVLKLLEQEPSGEYISRDAVVERLKKEDKILYTTTGLNYLIRAIEELPSVTQKSETVTEFADRCRECGAKYGRLLMQEPCEDAIKRAYMKGREDGVNDFLKNWKIVNR